MLDTVKEMAHQHFQGARGSHAWDHTLRVCRLCKRLGSAEGVDSEVLLAAAYLHDIGRGCQDDSNGAVCHAEKGARMAAPIVERLAQERHVFMTRFFKRFIEENQGKR